MAQLWNETPLIISDNAAGGLHQCRPATHLNGKRRLDAATRLTPDNNAEDEPECADGEERDIERLALYGR